MKKLITLIAIGIAAATQAGLFDIKINTRGSESNNRAKRSSWQLVDRKSVEEKTSVERAAAEKAEAERKATEKAAEREASEDRLASIKEAKRKEFMEAKRKEFEARNKAAEEERLALANKAIEEERLALARYEDGTEMPPCVVKVAEYLRRDFHEAIMAAGKIRSQYYDFCKTTDCHPWGVKNNDMFRLVNANSHTFVQDAFKYWVLREDDNSLTWRNPPVVVSNSQNGKCFPVGAKRMDGRWLNGTWFKVMKNGKDLESGCEEVLVAMKTVVRKLDNIEKLFGDRSETYAKRCEELHGGFVLNPYKSIHFGDTPYCVYTNLSESVNREVELDARTIPVLPWRETCGLMLSRHKLEMGFSKFADEDAPGLTYLRLVFIETPPSIDDLKKKYEALGFAFESKKECIGRVWLDPKHVDAFVASKYQNAKVSLAGAMFGGVSQSECERAQKTLAEIEAKHMKPVYRETAVGTHNGYYLEIKTKGVKIRDGVPEGNGGDPESVLDVVFWDKAATDAQQVAYANAQLQESKAKEQAAAEKAKAEKAAALDF